MNKSDSIKEIATALSKAQGEFQNAKRDKENPFYHSKYADLTSLWDICRPVLSKNGLSVAQGPSVNESHVTINTLLMHNSGEWIESELILNADKPNPQSVGSAITYGCRYSLAAMLGLVADDDDDGNEASKGKGGQGKTETQKKTAAAKTAAENNRKTTKPDPSPLKKTEQKTGAPKDPKRQKIIDKIGAILKNAKFTDDDRTKARVEISVTKSNVGLEALRATWQGKLNRLLDDFKDAIPMSADEEKAIEEGTSGLFPEEEKAAKEAAEKKALETPDIY